MSTLLDCHDIVSGYLNRPVLRDVSIRVSKGQAVAVIGPNGHGKTTLLRTLSGLLDTRSGEMMFDGQPMSSAPVHGRVEAGLIHVPQGDQLFSAMTVKENLLMGGYLSKDPGSLARKLDEVFELFPKLRDRLGQITSGLSGGERRMVGIGRGLMAESKLIMLDEPSLGLSPLLVEEIYGALHRLRDAGKSFLIVEENPSRLMAFVDWIFLMDAGRVIWNGAPEEARASGDIFETYLGGH